jgi:hypothetical protein
VDEEEEEEEEERRRRFNVGRMPVLNKYFFSITPLPRTGLLG